MKNLSKLAAILALILPAFSIPARADGDFDYYVLALTWAPSWCRLTGDERDAPQCDPRADAGFTLHGLWPQNEVSYPEYCRTTHRDPSRRETRAQSDLFGSSGSAWYQWKKHGRCAGLDPSEYYDLARVAFEKVNKPSLLRRIETEMSLPPKVVEQAFLEENQSITSDGITVTCRKGHIMEARICLTKRMEFRTCGADIRRDCTAQSASFPPIR